MGKKMKIIMIMAVLLLFFTAISIVSAANGNNSTDVTPIRSTFLGGNGTDNMSISGDKMAVAKDGSVYVVGSTNSSNLPATPRAYQTTISSSYSDVFIAKYSNDLSQLLACTYLGGVGNDYGNAIAINSDGDVYVTGYTSSLSSLTSPGGFPVATGAYDTTKSGTYEAFVAKFDSSLSELLACTFLGGGRDDYGNDITIDNKDNVYITGITNSNDFAAVTEDGYQPTRGSGTGFVAKLDSALSTLSACTYFNGDSYAIALGNDGNVYITGRTSLSTGVATAGAYDTSKEGANDAFIARFNSSLKQLLACTYFGGSGSNDDAYDITVGNDNSVYITGTTNSNDLPTTTNTTIRGSSDAYIARFNSSLNQLIACTYFGGSDSDTGHNIAVGTDNSVYITGTTNSNDLTTTSGAYDTTSNGGQDAFIACFNNSLSTLNYSTYYGGNGDDSGLALTLTDEDTLIMGGITASTNLPVKDTLIGSAVDSSFNGGIDLFMSLWFLGNEFKAPVAQFTADITSREAPLKASFTDKSSNFPTSWKWDFNNDGTIDSIEQHPTWTYTTPGNYTVKLIVSNSAGTHEVIKTRYITVDTAVAPKADFKTIETAAGVTTTVTKYKVNDTIQFTDTSTHYPTSWSWDFDNDGKIDSTKQDPTWKYTKAGPYTVKLTVSNAKGSNTTTKTGYITIASKLNNYSTSLKNTNQGASDTGIPGFVGPNGDGLCLDLGPKNYVNPIFVEWASKAIKWSPANQDIQPQWTNSSKALGPVTGDNFHIVSLGDLSLKQLQDGEQPGYIILGFKTAIANGYGPDFAVFENGFISKGGAGVAGQTFAELGYVEVSTDGIHFIRFPSISLTPGQVGGYGTIDPTNVYNLVGKHVNAYGYSWGTPFDLEELKNMPEVKNGLVDLYNINYIKIIDIPGNGFFRDSEGRPIYDAWITWGSGGLDLEAVGVINNLAKVKAVANFTANPTKGTAPLKVKFTNKSTGIINSYAWDFNNDGEVDSASQNPTWTYNKPGTYIVKLTVTGPTGSNTKTITIVVNALAPTVTRFDPANGATKVAASKTIKVTFNKAIKAGSNFWVELKNSKGTSISIKKSIKDKILTIDPVKNLAESLYTLTIHTGAVTDLTGTPIALKTSKFSVGTQPKITKIDPKNGAVKISTSKTIKVTFNENIKKGSKFQVELKNSKGKKIAIKTGISGKILTIKSNSKLAESLYTLTIRSDSITDLAGNPVAGKTSKFTVGTPPKVTKTDPKNGATKVSTGKTIKVTFNEAIKKGSKFNVELKNSESKKIAFKNSISGKVLTIKPNSKLAESLYTLVIHTGAVTDLAGNPVALKTTKFTVGTPPKVTKTDPKNNAKNIARTKTIKVTFNENIKAGKSYRIELKDNKGKKVTIKKTIKGKTLTLTHTAKLKANTKYTLKIYTNSITDKAGNPITAKTYTFTTGRA